jgi:hypothetical protein
MSNGSFVVSLDFELFSGLTDWRLAHAGIR